MNSVMHIKPLMLSSLFFGNNLVRGYTPKSEPDTSELIRMYLFNSVVRFIRDENALQEVLWECDLSHISAKQKLISIYNWIVDERPLLVDKINQLRDSFADISEDSPIWKHENESHIRDILASEKSMREKDQTILKDIIDLRDYLTIV